MSHHESASQTAGPYVHIGCTPNFAGLRGVFSDDLGKTMRLPGHAGVPISLTGRIFDGEGEPLRDALVEIWQADANGHFTGQQGADPKFTGFGRCACDLTTGMFRFETVMPGAVTFDGDKRMAPHILFWIVARGINIGLQTRVYFPGEPDNSNDPVLSAVDAKRRKTLVATPEDDGAWRFDVRLQGKAETVFFDM
jgi:protocatechuate 3,4-dioxygenase alpha subunit